MATHVTYGPWDPSPGAAKRIRLRFEWSIGTPSVGASSVPVELRIVLETGYGWWDNHADYRYDTPFGAWSGTRAVRVPTNGEIQLDHLSGWLPINQGAGRDIAASASLGGVTYLGPSVTASHTSTVTLPGAPTGQPSTPRPTATLLSDHQARISWPAAANTDRYHLWQRDEANSREIAIGSTTGLSVTDSGLSPDNRYRWAVQAQNSVGASAASWTGYVRTTPAPPDLRVWRDQTRVLAEVTPRARYGQGWELERSINGGPWQTWTSWGGGASTATMTVSPGQTVQVRARSIVTEGGRRVSAWTTSQTVLALAPPAAPSLVAPIGYVSADDEIWLWWSHETRDGSLQTAAEVRWQPAGASAWDTRSVSGTTGSFRVQLTRGSYVWQARTRGMHAEWGPWSGAQGFQVVAPPTLQITAPTEGQQISATQVTPTLRWADPTGSGMASWRTRLLDSAGVELWAGSGQGAYRPMVVPHRLADATTYRLVVSATSTTGLRAAEVQRTFRTRFQPPARPTLVAQFVEERGVVTLQARAGAGGQPTASLRVEVSTDQGRTWQTILQHSTGAPLSGEDPLPPLCTEVWYRAVAESALPSTADSETTRVGTHTSRIWVNAVDGGMAAWCSDNASVSSKRHRSKVLEVYEGSTRPTVHFGPAGGLEATIRAELFGPDTGSSLDDWARMIDTMVWLRTPEPSRLRIHGVLTEDLIIDDRSDDVWSSIAVTVTEAEGHA